MSLKEAGGRVAILTALRDAIADELTAAKAELSAQLGTMHEQTGMDGVEAALPDGQRVGRVAWIRPGQRFRVSDEGVFAEYVLKCHPSEVVTTLTVRPVFVTAYLNKTRLTVRDGAVVDRETGEEVPGVEAFEGAPYPRLTFGTDGRGEIARAWREGRLTDQFLAILPPVRKED